MGHYSSDMGTVDDAARHFEWAQRTEALQAQGYRWVSYDTMSDRPKLHTPCGLIVGDPETHNSFCPARDALADKHA
jgi:hypothetical protein